MSTEAAPSIDSLLVHAEWVERLAARLVQDAARADDVVQEVWLAALERPPRDARNPRAWLAKVAANAARTVGRAEGRRARRETAVAHPEAEPSSAALVERAELQREVVGDVLALDEAYREVVLLRYFEGLPPGEIAKRIGAPVATVQTRLQRARAELERRLASRYGDRSTWAVALLPLARRGVPLASAGTTWIAVVVPVVVAVLVIGAGILGWRELARPGATDEVALAGGGLEHPSGVEDAPAVARSDAASAREVEPLRTSRAPAARVAPPAPAASTSAATELVDLEGRVVDVDGRPVAGVELRWRSPAWPEREMPEEARRELAAKLRGRPMEEIALLGEDALAVAQAILDAELKPGRSGTSGWVRMRVPNVYGRLESGSEAYAVLTQGRRQDTDETVIVVAGVRDVRGVVVDEHGAPIADVDVSSKFSINELPFLIVPEHQSGSRYARTDAEGHFELLGLPVRDEGRITARKLGFVADEVDLPDSARADSVRIELAAEEERIWVTGVVVDRGGTPLEGCEVFFGQDRGPTDAGGRFRFLLSHLHESAPLVAWKKGYRTARVEGLGSLLREDRTAAEELRLTLEGRPLSLRGVVVDGDGAPVRDLEVTLEDGTPFGTMATHLELWRMKESDNFVTTDREGRFELRELDDRPYRIAVYDLKRMRKVVSEPFPAGSEDVRIVLDDEGLMPELRCRVVTLGGEPVPEARVGLSLVTFRHQSGGWNSRHGRMRKVDGFGRVVLEDVPRGHASLVVTGEGVKSATFPIADDMDTTLVVELERLVQVVLDDPASCDAFELWSADGERLAFTELRPWSDSTFRRGGFKDGRTHRILTTNRAHEIVYYKKKVEVGRTKLALEPDTVHQLTGPASPR